MQRWRRVVAAAWRDPRAVANKVAVTARRSWARRPGGWSRIAAGIPRFSAADRASLRAAIERGAGPIARGAGDAVFALAQTPNGRSWARSVAARAKGIRAGRFRVFDHEWQFDREAMPWTKDWRNGTELREWHPSSGKSFYADRAERWDVKWPWELSRMAWLVPLAQDFFLHQDAESAATADALVDDWVRANPAGLTVNAWPMECSIRALHLSMALAILSVAPRGTSDTVLDRAIDTLARCAMAQGDQVWYQLEVTDVRGNHYAANVVAMLVLGSMFENIYAPARAWLAFGRREILREIPLQLLPDGVDFEKSTAYHRLVTELFVLGALLLERRDGQSLDPRIAGAIAFAGSGTRPDGTLAIVGDNDSARVLVFEDLRAGDTRELVELGAVLYPDRGWTARGSGAAAAWLLGRARPDAHPEPADGWFPHGGFAAGSPGRSWFLADFGDVGMRGRGGHAHNDLFSFELWLDGSPVVVDAGIPCYTDDLARMAGFRKTRSHNTLEVDGEEQARPAGTWRIRNEACPYDVQYTRTAEGVTITGAHDGYRRLADPVTHRRQLAVGAAGVVRCDDRLVCSGSHAVRRFLHLPPTIDVAAQRDFQIQLSSGVSIRWDEASTVEIIPDEVSDHYGHAAPSKTVVLTTSVKGDAALWFEIHGRNGAPE